MKHYKRLHLGVLCLFVSFAALQAQEDTFFAFHTQKKINKTTQYQQYPYTLKKTNYYKHHKKLSVTHTGIVLELITSDLPLKRDYPLFKQFGNVYYDQLEGGGYAYCILTKFSKLKQAKAYLQQMILPHAPTAKVVKYQLGRRKRVVQ